MLLTTDWLALAGCLLATVLLCLGVLSRWKWLNALCYTIAAAVFTVHIADSFLDYLWAWLWPHPSTVILMLAAVWGPLIAVLTGLARYIRHDRDRRALYVVAGLVGLYGVYAVGVQLVDPGATPDSFWDGEVLIQSTSTTCVAAACCTYLRTQGIGLDEQRAVRDGLISHNGGSQVQAWRILRRNLPADTAVRIAPLTLAELQRSGRWYVTSVRYGPGEGHCIVVKGAGDYLIVRDPLVGEYEKDCAEFATTWLGVGLWAEPRG